MSGSIHCENNIFRYFWPNSIAGITKLPKNILQKFKKIDTKSIFIVKNGAAISWTYTEFYSNYYWTPGGSHKGPIKKGLSVLLSFRPFLCPGVFCELHHQLFLNFGIVLETYMKLYVTELDFPGKFFLPQKWAKNLNSLNLLENWVINFFLNLVYK